MELSGIPISDIAVYHYAGTDVFELEDNQQFRIKAHNNDILKVSVPSGKRWKISLTVDIMELNE